MQFLKSLSAFRDFENPPVWMTDSNNSLLMYSKHIFYAKMKLQHTRSAVHNTDEYTNRIHKPFLTLLGTVKSFPAVTFNRIKYIPLFF